MKQSISLHAIELEALRSLLAHAPVMIAVFRGPQAVCELFNPPMSVVWGDRDVIGQPMRQAWPELEGQGVFEMVEELIQSGQSGGHQEVPITADWGRVGRLSEKIFNFIYSPLKKDNGMVDGVMIFGFDITEQVLVKRRIAENEERYRSLFEKMDQGFCIIEILYKNRRAVDYKFLETNPIFQKETGFSEATGKTIRQLQPDIEEQWIKLYAGVASSGKPVRFTEKSEAMGGRWIDVYAYRLGEKGSKRVALLFTNITERIESNEELRRSEERLRLATGASVMVGTWDWDIAADLIYSDARFARLYSVDAAQAEKGAPASEYMLNIHPDDVDRVTKAIERTLIQGERFREEYRLLQKDGTIRWVIGEGQCYFDSKGAPQRFPGVIIDITARKEAEQALVESEDRFRVVTDNATTGLFIMNDQQYCTYMNPAAEKITGYSLSEILTFNKPLHDIIHHTHPDGSPYPMSECPIDRALPERNNIPGEDVFVRRDGSFYPVAFMASPIVKASIPVGTVIELRDISEEKKAQEEQQRLTRVTAQRDDLLKLNKAKDEFIALASHQLRTPATAVKQYISLVTDEYAGPLSAEQRQYLQTAYDNNERQLYIINDLLKTAQIDSSKYQLNKQPADIVRLLREAIEDMQSAFTLKKQRAIFMSSNEPIKCLVDSTEIKLVLINLLENAGKYSHDSRDITVAVEKKGRYAEIAVCDQGVGIKPEDHERIFEKFTRVSNELSDVVGGTGLGLYWVKQIVELHGGKISLTSRLGEGSCFMVKLPLEPIDR